MIFVVFIVKKFFFHVKTWGNIKKLHSLVNLNIKCTNKFEKASRTCSLTFEAFFLEKATWYILKSIFCPEISSHSVRTSWFSPFFLKKMNTKYKKGFKHTWLNLKFIILSIWSFLKKRIKILNWKKQKVEKTNTNKTKKLKI